MTDKKRKTGIGLIKSLHELASGDDVDNSASIPIEEVYSYLKKNNIAHNQIISDIQDRLNRMKAISKMDVAKDKRVSILAKLNSALPSQTDLKTSVKFLIDKIMTERPQLASAYFRKYESATENDLESLYQDLITLQELDNNDVEK